MLDQKDILSTLDMIDNQHLDIRTITMGISLLDCADEDLSACCKKIYDKITRCAWSVWAGRSRRSSAFPL